MKPEETTCPHCGDVFSTEKRMKCHMSLEHELQDNKVLQIEVAASIKKETIQYQKLQFVRTIPMCSQLTKE